MNESNSIDRLIGIADVSRRTGLAVSYLQSLTAERALPSRKFGHARLYDSHEIDQWNAARLARRVATTLARKK